MSDNAYQIDYDRIDVDDLMAQIQAHAREHEQVGLQIPEGGGSNSSLSDYLGLGDDAVYDLQQKLGLGGDWNLRPDDLRASHPGFVGRLIRAVRTLLRPVTKLLVNLELPLFKQFKINVGLAGAVQELARDNARLEARVQELRKRIDDLQTRLTGQTAKDA